jgi:multimeric flavodoxin WrbA
MGADILILSTPIWLGHPSSVAQRVMERLNAEISETDDEGRMLTYGKVAAVCVVGNEDGAHKVSADLFQGLNDVGFSLPPNAVTYWVGEAMQGTDFQDLDKTPDATAATTATLAANSAHRARRLTSASYPAG